MDDEAEGGLLARRGAHPCAVVDKVAPRALLNANSSTTLDPEDITVDGLKERVPPVQAAASILAVVGVAILGMANQRTGGWFGGMVSRLICSCSSFSLVETLPLLA